MTTTRNLYDRHWRTARAAYLRKHPLCCMCLLLGVWRGSTVVDHVVAHKGDRALFWDQANNWQPLCRSCHESRKKMLERGGRMSPDSSWGEFPNESTTAVQRARAFTQSKSQRTAPAGHPGGPPRVCMTSGIGRSTRILDTTLDAERGGDEPDAAGD